MRTGWVGHRSVSAGTTLPVGTHYVDQPEQLVALVDRIKRHQDAAEVFRCCLDTEADSLHHYQEKLCLIQLAYDDEFALIDPLALPDMSSLIDTLDKGEVWFHGADYDLTLLRRTYGWTPGTVRDTQIAARLGGCRHFGLAALIEAHYGKTLSKASQKADWSRRPLPSTMLHYAVDDVRYLLGLADRLLAQLEVTSRIDWFVESCDDLRASVVGRAVLPKEEPWRIQGSGKLHRKGLALLKALWIWRESIAKERDVPCFRVISNKQLIDIAIAFESGDEVYPPTGWRPKWKRDFEAAIFAVQQEGEGKWPERLRPKGNRMSEAARVQLEKLCQVREVVARQLDLEPSLLGARQTLEEVVGRPEGIQQMLGWQRKVFGKPLEEALVTLGFMQSAGEGSSTSVVTCSAASDPV